MSAALREGLDYNECRRSQPIPKSEQPLKRGADLEHGLVGQASCLSLRDGQDGTCYNYIAAAHSGHTEHRPCDVVVWTGRRKDGVD